MRMERRGQMREMLRVCKGRDASGCRRGLGGGKRVEGGRGHKGLLPL